MTRVEIGLDEGRSLAREWWGPHADVFEPNHDDGIDCYAVGHWDHALPVGDDALDDAKFPDLHLHGIGSTIAAAFRDADAKRWMAFCVRRRITNAARLA